MLLLQTMVGDRVVYMCHVCCTLLWSWAPARLLKAAQMWLRRPGKGCRTRGPHGRMAKVPGDEAHNCAAVQDQPPTPELVTQRGREDVFRKEELEKPEGERGRKERGGQAVLPPSWAWGASHLQQPVVTWVLGLAAHFLFMFGVWSP